MALHKVSDVLSRVQTSLREVGHGTSPFHVLHVHNEYIINTLLFIINILWGNDAG